jgi:hypothetical protein
MDFIHRHLDPLLRDSRDVADTATADAIGDEDRGPSLEATHARVMGCLVAERERRAGRKWLISGEESR